MATTTRSLPDVTLEALLDAGLHFGHQTKRWNPSMKPYIFGERNGIYIIDLSQTLAQIRHAQEFLYDTVMRGHSVLFVGTKKQAQEPIREVSEKYGQPYVVHRWLGGMLTNQTTIRGSVKRMRELETQEEDGTMDKLSSKKEVSMLRREKERLQRNLSGIADMDRMPAAIVIVDVNRESIAVSEARRLNIPIVALVDTNSDPDGIDYPIAGNDDGTRAIRTVLNVLGETVLNASNEYAQYAAAKAKETTSREEENERKRVKSESVRAEQEGDEKQRLIAAAAAAARRKRDEKAKEEAEAVVAEEAPVEEAPVVEEAAPVVEEAPAPEAAAEEAAPEASAEEEKSED